MKAVISGVLSVERPEVEYALNAVIAVNIISAGQGYGGAAILLLH